MIATAGRVDRAGGAGRAAVAERLAAVRERIAAAAKRAGRSPDDVRLVVVTKDASADRVAEAIAAGATDLGENRAQELARKMAALEQAPPPSPPRWHFIGTLQRNKVRAVVGRVVLVHSTDSAALGRAIAVRAAGLGVVQDVLLEVNVAGEPMKHGLAPGEVGALLGELATAPSIAVRGLMTIAPEGDPKAARTVFRVMRGLRDELAGRPGGERLAELSMGMTSDFEAAIEEGATIVRVGTAIFGRRSTPKPTS